MLTQGALVVEYIAAHDWVGSEIAIEYQAHRGPLDEGIWGLDMAAQIGSKAQGWHG